MSGSRTVDGTWIGTGQLQNDVRPGETAELLAELLRYLDEDPPAISLPTRTFSSPELYELERNQIFGRSWILIAHTDEFASPGDYIATTVASEPVMIVRDKDGVLHGLSPICRHRMMPVVEPGAGRADAFACPYHLWKYGLDGRLISATFMKRNKAFDPKSCRLPAFAVEQWHGFVYVNFDPATAPLGLHLSRIGGDLA